jgi:hypothetical protein
VIAWLCVYVHVRFTFSFIFCVYLFCWICTQYLNVWCSTTGAATITYFGEDVVLFKMKKDNREVFIFEVRNNELMCDCVINVFETETETDTRHTETERHELELDNLLCFFHPFSTYNSTSHFLLYSVYCIFCHIFCCFCRFLFVRLLTAYIQSIPAFIHSIICRVIMRTWISH